jgi:hypothetical protein
MSDDLDTAARYRQRANGLRNLASDKTNFAIRNHLLSIAEQYDRLAAMLEDIDATNVATERATAMTPPKTT